MKTWLDVFPYLPPDPRQKSSLTDRWVLGIGYFFVVAGIVITFSLFYLDSRTHPRISLSAEDWRVLFTSEDSDCAKDKAVDAHCPAFPTEGLLWDAKFHRGSAEYKDALERNGANEYWLGTRIPAKRLRRAAQDSAPTLILGHFYGQYDLWIDGTYYSGGGYLDHDIPLSITFPMVRLGLDRDLFVAIRVRPDPSFPASDQPGRWGAGGFYTTLEADKTWRWSVLEGITRHLVALGMFLLFSRILRVASAANQYAYDYIVGSQFALLLSTISLISGDYSTRLLSVNAFDRFFFYLVCLEGVFVVRLALAILRSERWLSLRTSAFMTLFSVVLLFFVPIEWIREHGLIFMPAYVLPVCYLSAALLVGLRAREVFSRTNAASTGRIEFLTVACFTLAITGVSYFIESWHAPEAETHWSRYLNLITFYLLVRCLAKDYRMAVQLVESAPVSKYHKQQKLPQSIEGWVLMIDLRKSEHLFRAGASRSNGGAIVNAVVSHLWSVIHGAGGQVLQSEGDSLVALFEKDASNNENRQLLAAIAGLDSCLKDLSTRLKDALPEGTFLPALTFRASAVRGAVRPVWKSTGDVRLPAWIEAGNGNAFVDGARIMDLDRSVDAEGESLVIFKSEEAEFFQQEVPTNAWCFQSDSKTDKTGSTWRISGLICSRVTQAQPDAVGERLSTRRESA